MSGDKYTSNGKYMSNSDGDLLKKVRDIIENVRQAESNLATLTGLSEKDKLNTEDARMARSGRYQLSQMIFTGDQILDLIEKHYRTK